ncbi:SET domain-containing protein [Meredithblackwellia eburnea MCA 4105]
MAPPPPPPTPSTSRLPSSSNRPRPSPTTKNEVVDLTVDSDSDSESDSDDHSTRQPNRRRNQIRLQGSQQQRKGVARAADRSTAAAPSGSGSKFTGGDTMIISSGSSLDDSDDSQPPRPRKGSSAYSSRPAGMRRPSSSSISASTSKQQQPQQQQEQEAGGFVRVPVPPSMAQYMAQKGAASTSQGKNRAHEQGDKSRRKFTSGTPAVSGSTDKGKGRVSEVITIDSETAGEEEDEDSEDLPPIPMVHPSSSSRSVEKKKPSPPSASASASTSTSTSTSNAHKGPTMHALSRRPINSISTSERPEGEQDISISDSEEDSDDAPISYTLPNSYLDADGDVAMSSASARKSRNKRKIPVSDFEDMDSETTATLGLDGAVKIDAKLTRPRRRPDSRATSQTASDGDQSLRFELNKDHPVQRIRKKVRGDGREVPIELEVDGREFLQLRFDVAQGEIKTEEEKKAKLARWLAKEQAKNSHERLISGPSFPGEFSSDLQDHVNKSRRIRARIEKKDKKDIHDPSYTQLFEQMIEMEIAREVPIDLIVTSDDELKKRGKRRPTVRVVPPPNGLPPYSPNFEFYNTNRAVYDDKIVPETPHGCGCKGNCADAPPGSCRCRRRQEEACSHYPLLDQNNYPLLDANGNKIFHKGFAYTEDGTLVPDILERSLPIWECNSECGCDSICFNRVVGRNRPISVDLYHTKNCGWAVRNPPKRDGGRIIPRGTALSIYSGEILVSDDAYRRESKLYRKVLRNYIFDINFYHIGEALARQEKFDIIAGGAVTTSLTTPSGSTKGKKKGKRKRKKEMKEEEKEKVDDSKYESVYSVDAFHYGNWTRFCNHQCAEANTVVRSVYVDDQELTRPLLVFYANKDIKAGDQICISYAGDDHVLPSDMTLEQYQDEAQRRRMRFSADKRCFCGHSLCRGIMFDLSESDDDDNGGEEEKEEDEDDTDDD